MTPSSSRLLLALALACGCVAPPRNRVSVLQLDAGEVQLIGALGTPLGTFHTIEAEFAMVTAHGRVHHGGRILLKVLKVDGQQLPQPIYLPYFKAMTLQDYELSDGTDMFPRSADYNSLRGRTVVCSVYEDIIFLDRSSNASIFDDWPPDTASGFARPSFETALGIRGVR